ncbi:unnamed protein product [Rotaria sp. Silwood2]|nr:unnamed protein product [Rotaria sp. Silwood2]CAF3110278.1 unnamed protein product [Rotaria sp. Silwood2]CAF3920064.1 unnamed protein product [Rotaria sp. Silwood2]CAF4230277.1 unnamed protein product [Rotaria sp. Silwood2]CAF4253946.1 unnamed protein product [Rotaria sp. Silwood2]
MNRIAFNGIVRVVRVNPAIRTITPCRWESYSTSGGKQSQGSAFVAGAAGGLVALLGGTFSSSHVAIRFAWYHFSGTRQVVNIARDTLNKAQQIKEKVTETSVDSTDSVANTVSYLRSATTTLIPGSAPFLGKVFDQIEQISKDHGDDAKRIFDETYNDFEKLAKEGGLEAQTASKAVDILQKRVKELQDLAGEAGGDLYSKLISDNPKLKDQISEQYNKLKDIVDKAKEKQPELQNILKDTISQLTKIFKENGVSKETVQQAQDLLKKKVEEAKKAGEDVAKKAKHDNCACSCHFYSCLIFESRTL